MKREDPGYRTALVTGGARRIGRAIAEDLAAHGFKIAIHYHEAHEEAERLMERLRDEGGEVDAFRADLTNDGECRQLVGRVSGALGPIDLLVNNASIFLPDNADEPDMTLMDRHLAIHLKAPVLLGATFARQEGLKTGLIVNMIDQRVWSLTPRYFSYTLSKSALWTATRTMAQQFAPNIRVNAIGPGPSFPNERQSERDFSTQVTALPLKRGPESDEFGATVRYFFDNRSITGQMVALDGGQHLAWPANLANIEE